MFNKTSNKASNKENNGYFYDLENTIIIIKKIKKATPNIMQNALKGAVSYLLFI